MVSLPALLHPGEGWDQLSCTHDMGPILPCPHHQAQCSCTIQAKGRASSPVCPHNRWNHHTVPGGCTAAPWDPQTSTWLQTAVQTFCSKMVINTDPGCSGTRDPDTALSASMDSGGSAGTSHQVVPCSHLQLCLSSERTNCSASLSLLSLHHNLAHFWVHLSGEGRA